MSGLAALFHRDGRPADERMLQAMLAAIPYRGPDGTAIHAEHAAALGIARMAVTAEDLHEHQPIVSPRTETVVIADVRLDNREELLGQLMLPATTSIGDAEIILRAYQAWGIEAIGRLIGDFAFILWDGAQRRMICARDTSGQRSLFYRIDQRTFAVASEVHQLFADASVSITPNEARIRDYLLLVKVHGNERDHPASFFAGISAVPAGHVLVVDECNTRLDRYWTLDEAVRIRYKTDDEYAEHFYTLFSDVVRAQTRSSYPIGAFLSGGLDSSSIVSTAQHMYQSGRAEDRGFVSFSLTYDGLDCDESHLIRDVQERYGFDARFIPYSGTMGLLQRRPAGFMEAPNAGIGDRNGVLMAAASEAGVRAVLTGQMADSCVNGSRHVFDSLLRQGKLMELLRHLRAYNRLSDEPLRSALLHYCLEPLLPMPLQQRINIRRIRRLGASNRNRLLPNWIADPLRSELSEQLIEIGLAGESMRQFSNPAQEGDYRKLYPPDIARHPAPWPIEIRRPFADRRLHEFLLAIPPEQKFDPHPDIDHNYAGSKRIVRRSMRGIVPESIRARTIKTEFTEQFRSELIRNWAGYEATFGPSERAEVAVRGYVNQGQFWDRLQQLRAGQTLPDFAYIMNVVTLESWLRLFDLPREEQVTLPFHQGANRTVARREARAAPVGAT